MKKAAAISASVALGAMSAVAPALSANADTVTTQCTAPQFNVSLTHFHSSNTNWFDTCIPQYGRGKAEFTITSDVDFPADFKPLSDPSVSVSTNFDTAAADTYFSVSNSTKPYVNLSLLDLRTTAKSQTYRFSDDGAFFRIAKVESVLPSALPAACTAGGGAYASYWMAYKVTYLPTIITFDQVVAGQHWTYKINAAPAPIFLGMSPNEQLNSPISDTDPICWSDGTHTIRAASATDGATYTNFLGSTGIYWDTVHSTGIANVSPYPYAETLQSIGTFPRYVAKPALANTGMDARPALLTALGLLMAGLATTVVTRRRRKH